jgi:hypothetical protein
MKNFKTLTIEEYDRRWDEVMEEFRNGKLGHVSAQEKIAALIKDRLAGRTRYTADEIIDQINWSLFRVDEFGYIRTRGEECMCPLQVRFGYRDYYAISRFSMGEKARNIMIHAADTPQSKLPGSAELREKMLAKIEEANRDRP